MARNESYFRCQKRILRFFILIMTKNSYTFAAAVFPFGTTIYVFDSKECDILEMINLEREAMWHAAQRQWRLFKKFETLETDVELRVSLN